LPQVHSLYQPVVHLQTRTVIGYEALARGPEGTELYTPDALFAAARAQGTLGELDWACRIAAFDGAVKAHLPSTLELFVNVEAAALNAPPPPGAAAALSAAGGLSVVIELTERDLTGDVAGLLRAVERARAQGWRIALDDVGAAPASLALLPFLRPEIIKLDLSGLARKFVGGWSGIVEVEVGGAVEGFFGGAGGVPGGQDLVLVAVLAGEVEGEAPAVG